MLVTLGIEAEALGVADRGGAFAPARRRSAACGRGCRPADTSGPMRILDLVRTAMVV